MCEKAIYLCIQWQRYENDDLRKTERNGEKLNVAIEERPVSRKANSDESSSEVIP